MTPPPATLPSLAALKAAHAEMLKRQREAPDPLALLPAGKRLRATFEDAAEAAADRTASARVPPLRLAWALLKVARLTPPDHSLETTLAGLHRDGAIADRARALVEAASGDGVVGLGVGSERSLHRGKWLAGPLFVVSGLLLLPQVHALLEDLVHLGR